MLTKRTNGYNGQSSVKRLGLFRRFGRQELRGGIEIGGSPWSHKDGRMCVIIDQNST